ncbi:hypothetical protein GGX14DRAFT_552434 [Mycena pura]|uniref:Mitochondrial carrier protein n=1 Tax=Mycena pura TaxID=153505 RepID=A0AAD6V1F3_9AGAR|nr:hypothetical protein GGX14DRAFT_552434 [Mycena pura]
MLHESTGLKQGLSSSTILYAAALARTATRAFALYFSRPVRLFRPTKVSGWHSLNVVAAQDGVSHLSLSFLTSLVKNQGLVVIPKHFVPPMVVNALLGTVLWASYTEASTALQPYISHPVSNAAISGAVAGGSQALVSAPVENVRFLVQGGTSGSLWSNAWKEVFRGTTGVRSASRHETIEEARKVRSWMREVGGMAGRGWDGLAYTFGKDVMGFAAFFTIFEITRRIALRIRAVTVDVTRSFEFKGGGEGGGGDSLKRHLPQFLYGVTLVSGGVIAGISYEVIGRPWDAARHAMRLDRLTTHEHRSAPIVIMHKIQEEGFFYLFRDPTAVNVDRITVTTHGHRRIYSVLRTLARVGPWGIGFLVYQAYDSGLGQ